MCVLASCGSDRVLDVTDKPARMLVCLWGRMLLHARCAVACLQHVCVLVCVVVCVCMFALKTNVGLGLFLLTHLQHKDTNVMYLTDFSFSF